MGTGIPVLKFYRPDRNAHNRTKVLELADKSHRLRGFRVSNLGESASQGSDESYICPRGNEFER